MYTFVSPDRPDTVTLIASYIPLQEPAGGPYFYNFDEHAIYQINVDFDGTGAADIIYQFKFETRIRNEETFLYNTGPITSLDDPDFNFRQFYTVTRIGDNGKKEVLARDVPVPPANVGPRSTPNYSDLALSAVTDLPGDIKVFAGPRDDSFFIDVGSIFDLGGLRPFNPAHVIPLAEEAGVDGLSGFNVHTIALQVPINQLTRNQRMPSGPADPNAVIGVYANAMRQKLRVLTSEGEEKYRGQYVQVSRLGNPLVNEVIIPVGKKDLWNSQKPAYDDRFVQYYRKPELAMLINQLYPTLPDAPTTGREDLVAVLLTGVPGLNFIRDTKADLLRLNTAIPPSAAVGEGDRLGVPAGDLAGFPNGRRLEDDVTDIELRAVACGYGDILAQAPFNLCNLSPNNTIGDGVDTNDVPFLGMFPYLGTPHQGYEHTHRHGNSNGNRQSVPQ